MPRMPLRESLRKKPVKQMEEFQNEEDREYRENQNKKKSCADKSIKALNLAKNCPLEILCAVYLGFSFSHFRFFFFF